MLKSKTSFRQATVLAAAAGALMLAAVGYGLAQSAGIDPAQVKVDGRKRPLTRDCRSS